MESLVFGNAVDVESVGDKIERLNILAPIILKEGLKYNIYDLSKENCLAISGMTGTGKSKLIESIILNNTKNVGKVNFIIHDVKGVSAYKFKGINNVLGVYNTVSELKDILDSLYDELLQRKDFIISKGYRNIYDYNKNLETTDTNYLDELVLVIDELSVLTNEISLLDEGDRTFITNLLYLFSTDGKDFGIKLILSGNGGYSGVISDIINRSTAKVMLKVADESKYNEVGIVFNDRNSGVSFEDVKRIKGKYINNYYRALDEYNSEYTVGQCIVSFSQDKIKEMSIIHYSDSLIRNIVGSDKLKSILSEKKEFNYKSDRFKDLIGK